jgi:hypothetical protein
VLVASNTTDKAPVLVVNEVEASFLKLVEEMKKEHTTVALTVKESYISKYHYLLELRRKLISGTVDAMRTENKIIPPIMSAYSAGENLSGSAFTEIEGFFNTTLKEYATSKGLLSINSFFDPPLSFGVKAIISSSAQVNSALGITNTGQEQVDDPPTFVMVPPHPYPLTDPRRSGRVLFVNEPDILKRADIQEFILNNGPLYGIVPYGNSGLYYYGLDKLKQLTNGKSPTEVIRVIAKFVTQNVDLTNVTVTSALIGQSTFNPVPPPPATIPLGASQLAYTYPADPNATNSLVREGKARCSLVTVGNRKYYMHTGTEPQFSKHTPERIVLHHTSGWGEDAFGSVLTVNKCLAATAATANDYSPAINSKYWRENQNNAVPEWWPVSGIHYATDGNGNVAAGIPEDVYSVHANNWNNGGIGIEIGSPGMLTGAPGNLYWSTGERYYRGSVPGTTNFGIAQSPYIQNWQIIDLGFAYGDSDSRYTVEFTDVGISALETLLKNILTRWPNIASKIAGRNQWVDVWGLSGKPALGSTSNKAAYRAANGDPNRNTYGIVIHATGNAAGHDDTVPTPKLVAMLNRLGYNEG